MAREAGQLSLASGGLIPGEPSPEERGKRGSSPEEVTTDTGRSESREQIQHPSTFKTPEQAQSEAEANARAEGKRIQVFASWTGENGGPFKSEEYIGFDILLKAGTSRLSDVSDADKKLFASLPFLTSATIVAQIMDDLRQYHFDRLFSAKLSPGDLKLSGLSSPLSLGGDELRISKEFAGNTSVGPGSEPLTGLSLGEGTQLKTFGENFLTGNDKLVKQEDIISVAFGSQGKQSAKDALTLLDVIQQYRGLAPGTLATFSLTIGEEGKEKDKGLYFSAYETGLGSWARMFYTMPLGNDMANFSGQETKGSENGGAFIVQDMSLIPVKLEEVGQVIDKGVLRSGFSVGADGTVLQSEHMLFGQGDANERFALKKVLTYLSVHMEEAPKQQKGLVLQALSQQELKHM